MNERPVIKGWRAALFATLVGTLVECGTDDRVLSMAAPTSSVAVTPYFNVCPSFQGWSVNPTRAAVGSDIALSVNVVDQNDEAKDVSLRWRADSGSFSEPRSAKTDYTCEEEGVFVLGLIASDGECEKTLEIPIECFD